LIFNLGEDSYDGSYDKLKFLAILFRLGAYSKLFNPILGTASFSGMLERSGWDYLLIFFLTKLEFFEEATEDCDKGGYYYY